MLYVKSKLPNSTIVSEEPVSQKHYFLCPFIFILFDCFVVYCMHVAMTTQFPSVLNCSSANVFQIDCKRMDPLSETNST